MTPRPHVPLVSVMMPAFNVESFLPAALDSLIAQSYTNWQAIVIDDGSTDATATVLRSYAARESRIKPIFAKHGGRGYARNLSLEHCKGEYVAILDADDVATPDRFEKQVDFLSRNPEFGGVSGQSVSFRGTPVLDMRNFMPWPTDPDEIRSSLLSGRMRILNGASMIRQSVFAVYGRYRVDLKRAQDYEFFRRLAIGGVRLGALPGVVLLYRQERLIPAVSYFVESESFRHYADALLGGYQHDFASFQASAKAKGLYVVTCLRYAYLFAKLAIRYRRIR